LEIKIKPSQLLGVVFLTIAFAAISGYVQILSLFSPIIAVTYVLVGAKNDSKITVQSVIITFLMLMFSTDISYALYICITLMLPGILIGSMIYTSFKDEKGNKFEPLYTGIVAFIVGNMGYYAVEVYVLKSNVVSTLVSNASDILDAALKVVKSSVILDLISKDDLILLMLLGSIVFTGIIYSLIVFYLSAFAINKINNEKQNFPKFQDFRFPGNPVLVFIGIYLIVLLLDIAEIGIKINLLTTSLTVIFQILFVIQGIVIYFYYLKNISHKNNMLIFIALIAGFVMTMGACVPVIGMFDTIFDFRKVRRNKST